MPNRLNRRLLVLSLGSAGIGLAATQPAQAVSDSDPRDPAGRGRPQTGVSDSDPNDPAGRGRARTGVSDSDPRDPAGRGGYQYRPGERR